MFTYSSGPREGHNGPNGPAERANGLDARRCRHDEVAIFHVRSVNAVWRVLEKVQRRAWP